LSVTSYNRQWQNGLVLHPVAFKVKIKYKLKENLPYTLPATD
jgi:hypothetical protein